MDAETEQMIEKTVRGILEKSNMDEMTEFKIRKQASEVLDLDLSKPPYKALVKRVVQSFLEEQNQKEQQQREAEEDENPKLGDAQDQEYDDNGDLVICRLSSKRKVTLQEFRGKSLVSIREFYSKDGKELPTTKGISLTEEQWAVFKKNVPAIENAISKMESRIWKFRNVLSFSTSITLWIVLASALGLHIGLMMAEYFPWNLKTAVMFISP